MSDLTKYKAEDLIAGAAVRDRTGKVIDKNYAKLTTITDIPTKVQYPLYLNLIKKDESVDYYNVLCSLASGNKTVDVFNLGACQSLKLYSGNEYTLSFSNINGTSYFLPQDISFTKSAENQTLNVTFEDTWSVFKKVEYITFTKTGTTQDYFDTGYANTLNTLIDADILFNGNYPYGTIQLSSYTFNSPYTPMSLEYNYAGVAICGAQNVRVQITQTYNESTGYVTTHSESAGKTQDTTTTSVRTFRPGEADITNLIGTIHKGTGTDGRISNITLWSFAIKENNTKVMDFVPAVRNSDNQVGLLDVISNKFYVSAYNLFTAGPDIEDVEEE